MAALRGSNELFYVLWLPMIGIVFLGGKIKNCRADTLVRPARAGVPALHERLLAIVVLLILLLWLPACGGGSPAPKPGTTPGTYTLTITGTSGSLTRTASVTLTVQ